MKEIKSSSDSEVEACVREQVTQMEKSESFSSFNSAEQTNNQHLTNICSGPDTLLGSSINYISNTVYILQSLYNCFHLWMRKGKFREFKKFWHIIQNHLHISSKYLVFLMCLFKLKTYHINSFSLHRASETPTPRRTIKGLDQVLPRVRYLSLNSYFQNLQVVAL